MPSKRAEFMVTARRNDWEHRACSWALIKLFRTAVATAPEFTSFGRSASTHRKSCSAGRIFPRLEKRWGCGAEYHGPRSIRGTVDDLAGPVTIVCSSPPTLSRVGQASKGGGRSPHGRHSGPSEPCER